MIQGLNMQKTPVSILQEMMVKKGTVPNYELIHDGGGTHENTFTYKVATDGLSATGTGRCKKDAKHAAAKNMLETIALHNGLLPLPASPAESPVRTPLPKPMPTPHILPPNEPFVNAIGELQDICAENELGEVVYETISDIGPPHARIFTIQCYVSSFKEVGEATTKKQAKHEAARKMYQRIKELVDNAENIAVISATGMNNTDSTAKTPEEIAEIVSKLPFRRKAILGVKISDYHSKLTKTFDRELRHQIIKKLSAWKVAFQNTADDVWNTAFVESNLKKLEEILSPLSAEIQTNVCSIDNDDFKGIMVLLHVNLTPEIVEVSIGQEVNLLYKSVCRQVVETLNDLLV